VAKMADKDFKKSLEDSINNADPRLDKDELLEDIFKTSVAKLLQFSMENGSGKKKDRLEMGALLTAKRELIAEFRSATLDQHQKSVEQYEELFQKTLQEIFNDASHAHGGDNNVEYANQNLEINSDVYINEGGLFVPSHMKNSKN